MDLSSSVLLGAASRARTTMLGRPEAPHAAGQWRPVDPPVGSTVDAGHS